MADYSKKKKNPTTESMKTIRSHIESGSFSRIYLLYGDEQYLVNQYRDMLIKALVNDGDTMNYTSYTSDTFNPDSVYQDMITMPFLAEHRTILVEESGLFDKSEESILSSISEMSDTNVLIFCETKVDKRKKPYSLLSKSELSSCLEFQTPDIDTLSKWVSTILAEGEMKVKMTVPEKLIATVGNDMNMLKNEAVKLHDYCMERGEITDKDVTDICVNPVEDKIFDMCEAISRKDSKKALSLYNDLCILKTKPMTVIFLITRQYNQLVQVSEMLTEGADPHKITSYLKTPEFVTRKYISICKNYKHPDLLHALDMCQQADLNVKTGRLTDVNAAENLIVNLITI
ncbi:DNA polymerase III, delta subunit [Lachnospiraceae bacterium]|nr:DNA polymerase III, delta subunit [Lachnospiraceae bacterium]